MPAKKAVTDLYTCPECNGRRIQFGNEYGVRFVCLQCQEQEVRRDDNINLGIRDVVLSDDVDYDIPLD